MAFIVTSCRLNSFIMWVSIIRQRAVYRFFLWRWVNIFIIIYSGGLSGSKWCNGVLMYVGLLYGRFSLSSSGGFLGSKCVLMYVGLSYGRFSSSSSGGFSMLDSGSRWCNGALAYNGLSYKISSAYGCVIDTLFWWCFLPTVLQDCNLGNFVYNFVIIRSCVSTTVARPHWCKL